jgi:CheY-like chemotaxis protein
VTISKPTYSDARASNVLLFAEDDLAFAELLQLTLKRSGQRHRVMHLADGEQVLAYLKGEGKFADRNQYPLPALLLLDLKMPRVDGFTILRWIREFSPLAYLPVVVLTSSQDLRIVNLAYQYGANSFLTKPSEAGELKEMLRHFTQDWFNTNVWHYPEHVPTCR